MKSDSRHNVSTIDEATDWERIIEADKATVAAAGSAMRAILARFRHLRQAPLVREQDLNCLNEELHKLEQVLNVIEKHVFQGKAALFHIYGVVFHLAQRPLHQRMITKDEIDEQILLLSQVAVAIHFVAQYLDHIYQNGNGKEQSQ